MEKIFSTELPAVQIPPPQPSTINVGQELRQGAARTGDSLLPSSWTNKPMFKLRKEADRMSIMLSSFSELVQQRAAPVNLANLLAQQVEAQPIPFRTDWGQTEAAFNRLIVEVSAQPLPVEIGASPPPLVAGHVLLQQRLVEATPFVTIQSQQDLSSLLETLKRRQIEEEHIKSSVEYNLFVLYSHWNSKEKEVALKKLVHPPLFTRPVARQRWQALGFAFREAIKERAARCGKSAEETLQSCIKANLLLAMNGDNVGSYTLGEIFPVVRRLLNEYVTEDLLGFEWRRRGGEVFLDTLDAEGPLVGQLAGLPEAELEAKLTLEAIRRRAELVSGEAEVLLLRMEGKPYTEIALHLGISEQNARTICSRAKKKLEAVIKQKIVA